MTGKYYLGRKVVDNYGRTLGKVIGYYIRDRGSSPLLGLELIEGDFITVPSTRLIDEANIFVLDENWKTKAENLAGNLTHITRKISALNKLYGSGEISQEAYDTLGKDFETTVQDLRIRREDLLERLDERSKALNTKLKGVEDYFVNVKVGHELGEMDDDAYKISRDALHDLINRLQTEQKDITAAQESLHDSVEDSDYPRSEQKEITAVQENLQQTPTYTETEPVETPETPPQMEPQENNPETPIFLRIEEAER